MPQTDAELLSRAVRIVDQAGVGMLTTVDAEGWPHARWMSAMSRDRLRTLHTLSAKETRKMTQLAGNPKVCWVFSTADMTDTVQLMGQVRVHNHGLAAQRVWDELAQAVRTYVAGPLSDDAHLEMVVLETIIERIEITSPALKIYAPRQIALA